MTRGTVMWRLLHSTVWCLSQQLKTSRELSRGLSGCIEGWPPEQLLLNRGRACHHGGLTVRRWSKKLPRAAQSAYM